ncbi:glycosyl transferase group 1 [Chthoniobacter flavus Ellin428]|uniref:Glycosyl transferase group 1 n=1 Tax=Chthoniobacter flavus Ellin428 TaxID=497964 RepID=B4D6F7_9BACT|nr:glycosyltransferase family 4 protein [Chthoniobacter flavus]EDY18066.1 glycosyl transferase group 1 [Chthoniobacter flavus Ellin428]TCO88307.1 glycosyltransferase involved in cell wall biosynthesis [Chthoniobacter flavus]
MPAAPHSFAYLFERFPSFVQTFVYREAVEMVRQGMNPWLVSLRRPDDPGDLAEKLDVEVFYAPEEKELRAEVDGQRKQRKLSWRPHKAIPRHRHEPDAQRMFEAIWLGPRLREKGIRHVHAHFGGVAARTAWWLRKLYGIGYSFTGHANDIFCDTDFPVSNADLVRDARFVVTETDYARRWMEKKYPWAKGKVFRVFNGVATDGFPAKEPASGVPRIISVGRYVEKKGFGDLIQACGLLRDRGIDFVCGIVGGGPLEAQLQSQITEAKLDQQVQLLGPRSQNEVRRMLAAAQLFVLACVPEKDGGSDNLPTVIMEAMLARTPVISTELAGVPEMITPGQDGLLVLPQNPVALAEAMAGLLTDPSNAERLGQKGRTTAEEKFAVDKTTGILKHLLAERAPTVIPDAARRLDPSIPVPSVATRLLQLFR